MLRVHVDSILFAFGPSLDPLKCDPRPEGEKIHDGSLDEKDLSP